MKKAEILRSRNLFKRIVLEGKKFSGVVLRCAFLLHNEGGMPLQVGFKVSSRKLNAVRRNKIRRWMREGMSAKSAEIEKLLRTKGYSVGVVISYKGLKELPVEKLNLSVIQKDISAMCRTIASLL